MKKILTIATALFVTLGGLQAQQTVNAVQDSAALAKDTLMKDYVSMQGGQLIIVKNNKAGRMEKEMTMKNGTIVKSTGEVLTKDGHSFQLKEGDRIYFNGWIEGPSKSPM